MSVNRLVDHSCKLPLGILLLGRFRGRKSDVESASPTDHLAMTTFLGTGNGEGCCRFPVASAVPLADKSLLEIIVGGARFVIASMRASTDRELRNSGSRNAKGSVSQRSSACVDLRWEGWVVLDIVVEKS